MGMTLGEAYVSIYGDRKQLNKDLRTAEKDVSKSASKMENSLSGAFKNASKQLNKMGTQLTNIGKGMTLKGALGLGAVAAGMTGLLKPAANLQEGLLNVSTLFSKTEFDMKSFRDEILKLSTQVPKSTADLTDALYQIKSAGIEGAKSIDFLKVAAVSSIAGITTTEAVVRALTKTLEAYGLEAENAEAVSSKMFKTVELGQIDFGQMAEAIPTVAAEAATSGLTLDELMGVFAAGTKTLGDFTQVTVGVSGMLNDIGKASDNTKRYAKELGFEFSEEALQTKGLVKFLEDMRGALAENNVSAREFFNRRQSYRLANALLGNSFETLKENIDDVADSQGAINRAFQKQMGGLNNQARLAWNTVTSLAKSIGSELIPEYTDLTKKVRAAAQVLMDKWVNASDETREKIAGTISKVAKLAAVFLGLVTVAGLVSMGLGLIIKAGALVMGVLSILTNPIVLLIAAIGLLYTAWTNDWFGIRTAVTTAWEDYIKPALEKMWEWLQKAWNWTVDIAGKAWDWIKNTTWQEKLEDMKGWLTDGWDWIVNLAGDAWNWLDENAPWLTGALETAWEWTVEAANDLFNWIKDVAWPWIKDGASTIWEWTVEGAQIGYEKGKQIVEAVLKWTMDYGEAIGEDIKTGLETGDWSGLIKKIRNAGQIVLGIMLAKGALASFAASITTGIGSMSGFTPLMGIAALTLALKIGETIATDGDIWPDIINALGGAAAGFFIAGMPGAMIGMTIAVEFDIARKISESFKKDYIPMEEGTGLVPNIYREINKNFGLAKDPQKSFWEKYIESEFGKIDFLKNLFGFASGGHVSGPGTGTSDSIPAMVSNGEFIVNSKATKKWLPLLMAINSGLPGFQEGGLIGGLDIGGTKQFLSTASGQLGQTATKMFTMISNIMKTLFQTIINALKERFPEEAAALEGMMKDITDVLDELKSAFDENSDSVNDNTGEQKNVTTTLRMLKDAALGLVNSFVSNMPILNDALAGLQQGVISKIGEEGFSEATEGKSGLSAIWAAFQASPFAAILGILQAIIPHSKVFASIIEMLNPIFQELANIAGAVLLPILKILSPIIKAVGEVLRWVAETIVGVWNGLMDVLHAVLGWAHNFKQYKVSLDELTDTTEDVNKEFQELTRNVPYGFKIALERFRAAEGRYPSAQTGGFVTKTGLINVHAGEVITPAESVQAGTTVINFHGPVFGINDLKRKVVQFVDEANQKRKLATYGTTGGGR